MSLPGALRVFVVLKQGFVVFCFPPLKMSRVKRNPTRTDDLRLETSNRVLLDTKHKTATFNETFTFPLTMNQHESTEKKARVGVYAVSPSHKVKVLGECTVTLGTFCNESEPRSLALVLQNCLDKKAFIELGIRLCENPKADRGLARDFSVETFDGLRSLEGSPGQRTTFYGGSYSREGSCERVFGTSTLDSVKNGGGLTLRTGNIFDETAVPPMLTTRTGKERNPIKVFQDLPGSGSNNGDATAANSGLKTARVLGSKENLVLAVKKTEVSRMQAAAMGKSAKMSSILIPAAAANNVLMIGFFVGLGRSRLGKK